MTIFNELSDLTVSTFENIGVFPEMLVRYYTDSGMKGLWSIECDLIQGARRGLVDMETRRYVIEECKWLFQSMSQCMTV